jgi:hypothetical protein
VLLLDPPPQPATIRSDPAANPAMPRNLLMYCSRPIRLARASQ